MDQVSHSQSGWKQAPVVQASNGVVCNPSQSASGVGAWCGRQEVVTVPGKEVADSDSWLHPQSGLIFHSQVAPLSDQPSWMDGSSHSSWDQSGGFSAHYPAWDPGGVVRAQNRCGQYGTMGQEWNPLAGPPDGVRPWFQGSPGWTGSGCGQNARLMVPEADAGWLIVVPNAGAGQVVKAGQGLGFYHG